VLLPATGHLEGFHVVAGEPLAPGRLGNDGALLQRRADVVLGRVLCHRHQPTDPSICSSMSRLSSSAYSIGSSRAIGSTKPRTIIAIASSSARPRDIR